MAVINRKNLKHQILCYLASPSWGTLGQLYSYYRNWHGASNMISIIPILEKNDVTLATVFLYSGLKFVMQQKQKEANLIDYLTKGYSFVYGFNLDMEAASRLSVRHNWTSKAGESQILSVKKKIMETINTYLGTDPAMKGAFVGALEEAIQYIVGEVDWVSKITNMAKSAIGLLSNSHIVFPEEEIPGYGGFNIDSDDFTVTKIYTAYMSGYDPLYAAMRDINELDLMPSIFGGGQFSGNSGESGCRIAKLYKNAVSGQKEAANSAMSMFMNGAKLIFYNAITMFLNWAAKHRLNLASDSVNDNTKVAYIFAGNYEDIGDPSVGNWLLKSAVDKPESFKTTAFEKAYEQNEEAKKEFYKKFMEKMGFGLKVDDTLIKSSSPPMLPQGVHYAEYNGGTLNVYTNTKNIVELLVPRNCASAEGVDYNKLISAIFNPFLLNPIIIEIDKKEAESILSQYSTFAVNKNVSIWTSVGGTGYHSGMGGVGDATVARAAASLAQFFQFILELPPGDYNYIPYFKQLLEALYSGAPFVSINGVRYFIAYYGIILNNAFRFSISSRVSDTILYLLPNSVKLETSEIYVYPYTNYAVGINSGQKTETIMGEKKSAEARRQILDVNPKGIPLYVKLTIDFRPINDFIHLYGNFLGMENLLARMGSPASVGEFTSSSVSSIGGSYVGEPVIAEAAKPLPPIKLSGNDAQRYSGATFVGQYSAEDVKQSAYFIHNWNYRVNYKSNGRVTIASAIYYTVAKGIDENTWDYINQMKC